MNIVRENRKDLTTLLTVTVGEADYAAAVDKTLHEYKRKANVPGFRPGMVPMGIINKMYRKGAIAEESYKTASNACFEYIEKEKIDYIGDLLPSDEQKPLDFDNATDFEFLFEMGTAPQINLELSDKDKVTRLEIEINEEMHGGYRSNFLRKFGRLVDVDKVEKDEALSVTLDNESMNIEDAYVGLISMNDQQRVPFIGKKVGDTMDVDVNELYKTPSQRASILQVKEDELATIDPKFKLTITKIRKFADPELNEEFYKMAFPEGNVTGEKGLDTFIDEQISKELSRESDYMFTMNIRNFLVEKANLAMPEAFLKKWLFTINEGKFSMEDIEKDFSQFIDMMRWNLIQKHYVQSLELTVTQEDALEEAKALASMQFAQYGMSSVADDMLAGYAQQILGNKEESKKIFEKLYEQKVVEAVTPLVKIVSKSVSVEDFGKEVEKLQK